MLAAFAVSPGMMTTTLPSTHQGHTHTHTHPDITHTPTPRPRTLHTRPCTVCGTTDIEAVTESSCAVCTTYNMSAPWRHRRGLAPSSIVQSPAPSARIHNKADRNSSPVSQSVSQFVSSSVGLAVCCGLPTISLPLVATYHSVQLPPSLSWVIPPTASPGMPSPGTDSTPPAWPGRPSTGTACGLQSRLF